jgi:transposase
LGRACLYRIAQVSRLSWKWRKRSSAPTVFYRWQKEFFENGAAAFQTTERPRRQAEEKQKRIEFLEKKVQTKDEVLAELMAEHIALKKSLGEL